MERPDYSVLFDLIESHGLLRKGEAAAVDHVTFSAFRAQYLATLDQLDVELSEYLTATRDTSCLRSYVPFSDRAYAVASQVVWYMDEVVLRDPLGHTLRTIPADKPQVVEHSLRALGVLIAYREAIADGYVLPAGPLFGREMPAEVPPEITAIAADPAVRSALEEVAYCGYEERNDEAGRSWHCFQISLDSGGAFGWSFPGTLDGRAASPGIAVGEKFPRIDLVHLREILGREPFGGLDELFAREAYRAVLVAQESHARGCVALFDREVDARMIELATVPANSRKQRDAVGGYNLLLPFVRGISPARLAAVRQELPAAFLDFRGRIQEILAGAQAEELDQAEVELRIQREIVPGVRGLDAEMKATVSKSKVSWDRGYCCRCGWTSDWHAARVASIAPRVAWCRWPSWCSEGRGRCGRCCK